MTQTDESRMTCEKVEEQLLDYLEGLLPPDRAAAIKRHLKDCRECMLHAEDIRDVVAALHEAKVLSQDNGNPGWRQAQARDPGLLTTLILPAGSRLGDYEIIGELGRGGMGVVYRARQLSLDRPVALKVLSPLLQKNSKAVQRFHQEVRTAARLRHPHIVPIFAWGEQDGQLHYAMELIEGQPLSARLDRQRREQLGRSAPRTHDDFARLADRLSDICDALHYAHERGVVHRDIKPQNLLIGGDERMLVTDFGLAHALDDPRLTGTGEMVGTPSYMSPEQVSDDRSPLDRRSDVWSLGVTLYEALTLRRPFEGRTRDQIIAQIRSRQPESPSGIAQDIPPALETICLRALEKDVARRYPTAETLGRDLRDFRDGRFVQKSGPGFWNRLGSWARRTLRGPLKSASARSERNETAVREAYDLMVYHDYHQFDRAERLLDSVGHAGQENDAYHLARAVSLLLQEPQEALYHLDRVLQKNPEHRSALYLKAWVLRDPFPSQAMECLARGDAVRGSRTADQLFLRGQAVMRLGGVSAEEEAIACYREAISVRRPDAYPQAMLHLGRALNNWMFHHRSVERFDEIRRHLTTVVHLNDDKAYPRYLLSIAYRLAAEIYAKAGSERAATYFDEALTLARAAREIEPDSAFGPIAESETLLGQGREAEALRTYDEGLAIARRVGNDAHRREILHYRWRLYYWLGQFDNALADMEDRIELAAPHSADELWFPYLLKPVLLADMGRREEAVRVLLQERSGLEKTPLALLTRAGVLRLLHANVEADALLRNCRSSLDGTRCIYPYESVEWNRMLLAFTLDEATWPELESLARQTLPNDPSWLLASAHFISASKQWGSDDPHGAKRALDRCIRCYDYERYAYLARCLVRRFSRSTQTGDQDS